MKIYLLFSSRSFFAKNGEITNFEVFMPMDWKLNNELTIYLSDHFQHESHNTDFLTANKVVVQNNRKRYSR